MQWLPAIQYETAGWLLPLAPESSFVLASFLTVTDEPQDLELAVARLAQQLANDPALAIFSLLELLSRHPETAGKNFSVEAHAHWFHGILFDLFRDRSRQLATRQLAAQKCVSGNRRELMTQWQLLQQETQSLALEQRTFAADRWLSLTGPVVPESWKKRWPTLDSFDVDTLAEEWDEQNEADEHCTIAVHDREIRSLAYGQPGLDLYRLARDYSELRLLRERFRSRLQSEKLASLKQLAYGLSHEINNPLAAICARAEQLSHDEPRPQRAEKLKRIVDSAMRAHEMIADMMYFAKPPRPQFATVDAGKLTEKIAGEFRMPAREQSISIHVMVDNSSSKSLRMQGDAAQLGDALRALIRNAMEAIVQRGQIVVELRKSGSKVVWTVTDNGPGLSAEARQHAFDPYFSGREAGRGLGLGLCRVYRVAKAHGGSAIIEGAEVGCRVRMWARVNGANG